MKKLRVGVAGLGRGRLFIDAFSKIPGCEVVAVCDAAKQALEPFGSLATHTDYDAFLGEGLDIAAVITPGPVHAEQSVKAMEAGAHVLCETPCVYSLAEAKAVVECARNTGKKYMLAENYIWMGWMLNMKQKAEEGMFGDIVYAEGDYTHDCRNLMLMTDEGYVPYAERADHPDARKSWRATDLPPLYYCSHTLGPLLVLMDDRVTSVVGMNTGCQTAPDLGCIDLESCLMQTEKGGVIRLTNGFSIAHPMSTHYSIAGTKGSLKMQRSKDSTFVWYSDMADPPMEGWDNAPEEWLQRPDGESDTLVMVRDYVTSILNDTPLPIDECRSMDFVLPGIFAHESAMQGGIKLEIPDLR